MLSGPGRALVAREDLFAHAPFDGIAVPEGQRRDACVFVLEDDALPPDGFAAYLAEAAGAYPSDVTLVVTPTASLAGGAQVVARVVEVALHRAHTLDFPVERVVEGLGWAPLPPAGGDVLTAMGRTNDAILYGGRVHLVVGGDEDAARELAEALPSANSPDHGSPFAKTFAAHEYDFYRIDPGLFCPAEVWVTALDTGRTFHAGAIDPVLVARSFGLD
jgi:methenyltetrahydromethanopterin cyclohydrolase